MSDIWGIIRPTRNNSAIIQNQIIEKLKNVFKNTVSTFLPLQVKIIRQMNENQLVNFIVKITSFIHKWTWMYERARSCSLTKIGDFFFSIDMNFHIIFFINNRYFIYNSQTDLIVSSSVH